MSNSKRSIEKRRLWIYENDDNFYCCLNRHYLFHDLNEFSNFSDVDDDFNQDNNE